MHKVSKKTGERLLPQATINEDGRKQVYVRGQWSHIFMYLLMIDPAHVPGNICDFISKSSEKFFPKCSVPDHLIKSPHKIRLNNWLFLNIN